MDKYFFLPLSFAIILLGCANEKGKKVEIYDYDFYGNYIPTTELKINDYILSSTEIGTRDSLSGHYIDLIFLRFISPKADEEYYVVTNTFFSGTPEGFLITANDKVLGKIEISGTFLGKRGPLNDLTDDQLDEQSIIVFKGTINNKKLECTYFEGD